MRRPRVTLLGLVVVLGLVGCAQTVEPGWAPPSSAQPDQAGVPGEDAGGQTASHRLGVVVIDVQETFVKSAANKNIDQIIGNTRAVVELAGKHQTPIFITFESSKNESTGQGLPPQVRAVVPGHAQELIKTTFAATGLPAFSAAIGQAGLTHLIVLGAETDVCVLQTVLGLRAMGFTVMLHTGAVFTSEPNTAPALRRMRQADVVMVEMTQVRAYIEKTSPLPPATGNRPVKIIKPSHIAAVLDGFNDSAVGASSDSHKTAKIARMRELLLISEWFDFPLYGTTSSLSLPAAFAGLITKQIRPVAELEQDTAVQQVIIAGTDQGLASLAAGQQASREVFLMEDGLLSSGPSTMQAALLEGLYNTGAVPTTYKALYYGMTKSVDLSEWPKEWVDRDPVYWPKTKAPESLPPIVK